MKVEFIMARLSKVHESLWSAPSISRGLLQRDVNLPTRGLLIPYNLFAPNVHVNAKVNVNQRINMINSSTILVLIAIVKEGFGHPRNKQFFSLYRKTGCINFYDLISACRLKTYYMGTLVVLNSYDSY